MAETLKTELQLEFTYDSSFGLFLAYVNPAPFELVIGETYKIHWGEDIRECMALDGSVLIPGSVFVGNATPFGLSGNDEPFLIGGDPSIDMYFMSLTDTAPTTRTVSIYHVTEDEAGEDEEEQQGFIVRDRNGNLVEYYGKNTVSFDGTDGGVVTFTKGIAVEDIQISLDFSEGNQTITAPKGYLVKSAVIEKPVDLVKENIKRGVVIANIEGDFVGDTEEITVDGDDDLTFADGDFVVEPTSAEKVMSKVMISAPSSLLAGNIKNGTIIAGIEGTYKGEVLTPKYASGMYTATAEGSQTIQHGLKYFPDIVTVYADYYQTGYFVSAFGFAGDISETQNIQLYASTQLMNATVKLPIQDTDSNGIGMISEATPESFKVGGTTAKHIVGKNYRWVAIGNLIQHAGFFRMTLSLDGLGNLIVKNGVPEIQQLNIYVDGTLAKTVDYVHADEVAIDISDVTPEFKSYTITVDGVGEDLTTKYPYAYYEEVSGYVSPATGTCGETAYWTLTTDGTLTIYGEGSMDDYEAQANQPWYNGRSIITRVIVEDGITHIGDRAFLYLTNLAYIELPDGLTEIGRSMVYGCTKLTSITIPESVTKIGITAFYGCTGLTSITIPAGVTRIESGAIRGCTSLSTITILGDITYIGTYAFSDAQISSIVIPDSCTEIATRAFQNCTKLSSITIGNGVTSIGDYCFYNCTSLTSVVIPDSVVTILWRAFQNCTGLQSITIGSGVKTIGDNTFYGCSNLSSAIFKVTTGWFRTTSQTATSGTSISNAVVASASTVANMLKSQYVGYWWKRN